MIVPLIVNGVCLISALLMIRLMRRIRKGLHPRSAKFWPLSQQKRNTLIPDRDQLFASQYFVLFISKGCPVCLKLLRFLSANRREFERIGVKLMIAAPTSDVPILRKAGLGGYVFLDEETTVQYFYTTTAPLLYEVKNNFIHSAYLVNAGEDFISVVAPELWGN